MPTRSALTDRQREVYDFLVAYRAERGGCPGVRDICRAFGFRSLNTASHHLSRLEAKGMIRRARYKGRAIELVELPLPEPPRGFGPFPLRALSVVTRGGRRERVMVFAPEEASRVEA